MINIGMLIPHPTVRFSGIARTVVYDTPRDVMYIKLSLER